MGKKWIFSKACKWFIAALLLVAICTAGKRENKKGQLNFYQAGAQVFRLYIERQMLESQSVITGILLEQERTERHKEVSVKAEGFLPDYEKEHFLVVEEEMQDKIWEENQMEMAEKGEEIVLFETTDFIPVPEKQVEIKAEDYIKTEDLVKRFYTIDPTTGMEEDYFNFKQMQEVDCSVNKEDTGPHILVYHTHSQEAFSNSEAGKEEDSIIGAGKILADYLESYGFEVMHHKGKYDVEKRDYAYSKALPAIEELLKEYPQIQVVIDLHRDAVAEDTRLVTEIQGKEVAKVMFFNGLGRSKETGEIPYLKNPYLKENLAFSFQMKLACDEYYPGFARNIYLRAYRYNMHIRPKTLLIELGAQTNTKEEIQQSLAPLAHVLNLVMTGETRK